MISDFAEFSQTITHRTLAAGSWVNGFWSEGAPVDSQITAIVQPMKEQELQFASEGFRIDRSVVVKTDSELPIQSYVIIDGVEYLVKASKYWRNILSHWKHYCERVAE